MDSAQIPLWLMVLSSLLSGLIAVLISTAYYHRFEKRKWKLDTLRRLAATRFALTHKSTEASKTEFFSALNEVHVVFQDSPKVLEHLEKMHSELKRPDRLDDNIVKLFKVIFDALGIKQIALNDSFILRPFTPGDSIMVPGAQPGASR